MMEKFRHLCEVTFSTSKNSHRESTIIATLLESMQQPSEPTLGDQIKFPEGDFFLINVIEFGGHYRASDQKFRASLRQDPFYFIYSIINQTVYSSQREL